MGKWGKSQRCRVERKGEFLLPKMAALEEAEWGVGWDGAQNGCWGRKGGEGGRKERKE